jgi:hypothetical protein
MSLYISNGKFSELSDERVAMICPLSRFHVKGKIVHVYIYKDMHKHGNIVQKRVA